MAGHGAQLESSSEQIRPFSAGLQVAVGEPGAEGAAYHHVHPRRVHRAVDAVLRAGHHLRLLRELQELAGIQHALLDQLLSVLHELAAQPVLLRDGQPAIQEDAHAHFQGRLPTSLGTFRCLNILTNLLLHLLM